MKTDYIIRVYIFNEALLKYWPILSFILIKKENNACKLRVEQMRDVFTDSHSTHADNKTIWFI